MPGPITLHELMRRARSPSIKAHLACSSGCVEERSTGWAAGQEEKTVRDRVGSVRREGVLGIQDESPTVISSGYERAWTIRGLFRRLGIETLLYRTSDG